jgi:hypothetical protein
MASYVCKYNCIIYGAKFSIFMSKFVHCKYDKNIQHAGMEDKQYTFCLYICDNHRILVLVTVLFLM